jgi:pimeloyl-ACP methyl ester carboxylesterase
MTSDPVGRADCRDSSKPPSRTLLAVEARAPWELHALLAAYPPLLRLAPDGDGHPVLVVPGLAAGDFSTLPLRTFLRSKGYAAQGWKQGRNKGPRPGIEAGLRAWLVELAERYKQKVSVIGWSLGGMFARELARGSPELVRQVISLGSPFSGEPRANNAWKLYEFLSGRSSDDSRARDAMKRPPPVPSTAIYSRTDGIVNWQGCLEEESPTTQNIEVESSHAGLGHNPAVLYAIAERLAQPERNWKPFDRGGLKSLVFPDPRRDCTSGGLRRPAPRGLSASS